MFTLGKIFVQNAEQKFKQPLSDKKKDVQTMQFRRYGPVSDESGLTVGYPSNALVTLQTRSRFNRITLQHSSNIPDVK